LQDSTKFYPNWDYWFENIPSGNPDEMSAGVGRATQKYASKGPTNVMILKIFSRKKLAKKWRF
jgi:hypothetical protein